MVLPTNVLSLPLLGTSKGYPAAYPVIVPFEELDA